MPARRSTTSVTRAAIAARLVLVAALVGEGVVLYVCLNHNLSDRVLKAEVGGTLLFALAVVALRLSRIPARAALLLIMAGGIGFQAVALTNGPTASDDVFRYVWDGKVQLAGIDPYRYAPDKPQLDHIRGDVLFPDKAGCVWTIENGRCSLVNRPDVHTIYPPVAEAAFALARLSSGGHDDHAFPLQVWAALGAIGTGFLLAWRSLKQHSPPWTVALWSWCPVTAIELGNNAHIEWLVALLCVPALMCLRRGRDTWAGALVGAAIATKLYPGLLLLTMLKRRPARVVASAVAVVALSYVPHVAAVGGRVIGYLPGYLKEENYLDGGRFLLLDLVLPEAMLTYVAALVLLAAAVWAYRRSDSTRPEDTAVVLVGVALLVTTPTYSWYVILLLALIAMTGRVEWFPLVIGPGIAALGVSHFSVHETVPYRTACYGAALVGVLVWTAVRQRARRADDDQAPGAIRSRVRIE